MNSYKLQENTLIERICLHYLEEREISYADAAKIQPPVQLLTMNIDYINSPRFKLIDDTAQKARLQLYDEFNAQVIISPLAEYADVWKINDSVRPDKKRRGPAKKRIGPGCHCSKSK